MRAHTPHIRTHTHTHTNRTACGQVKCERWWNPGGSSCFPLLPTTHSSGTPFHKPTPLHCYRIISREWCNLWRSGVTMSGLRFGTAHCPSNDRSHLRVCLCTSAHYRCAPFTVPPAAILGAGTTAGRGQHRGTGSVTTSLNQSLPSCHRMCGMRFGKAEAEPSQQSSVRTCLPTFEVVGVMVRRRYPRRPAIFRPAMTVA